MTSQTNAHTSEHSHGTVKSYTLGFIGSIVLTVIAFGAVSQSWFSNEAFTYLLLTVCAVLQLLVQLMLFLHLSTESKPHWNLTTFLFAILIVFVIVAASIWIMYNLNINMQM